MHLQYTGCYESAASTIFHSLIVAHLVLYSVPYTLYILPILSILFIYSLYSILSKLHTLYTLTILSPLFCYHYDLLSGVKQQELTPPSGFSRILKSHHPGGNGVSLIVQEIKNCKKRPSNLITRGEEGSKSKPVIQKE